MTDLNKFTTQLKFTDAQARFVREACAKVQLSGTALCENAVLQACRSILSTEIPASTRVKSAATFGEAGSRIPEAKALNLSTKEYKRRVRILELAGLAVTSELVAKVPAAPVRVRKEKAAA